MSKKSMFVIVMATMLIVSVAPCCHAAKNPVEKLARGVMNVWNGQYEVYDKTHESLYYNGPLGFFPGVVEGVGGMVTRMFGGIYDILTFCIPVPQDYAPVVEPELNF